MSAPRVGAMQSYALTLDRFIEHAAKWHGATEVVTRGSGGVSARISYAALRDRSKLLSGALLSLGLTQGDNLAVLAWNSQAHLECWYGAMGVGIVCHTLNPRVPLTHLAGMIQQAANRVLVVSPDLTELVEKLLPLCPTIEHVVVLAEPGAHRASAASREPREPRQPGEPREPRQPGAPGEPRESGAPGEPRESGASRKPGAAVSVPRFDRVRTWQYEEFLEERGKHTPWGQFDENVPAGLCFTSGTTGAPKGVTYTHRSNYLHTVHQLQADVSGLTACDSVLVAVPMFHANGWGLPFAGPAVGAKLVLPSRYQDGRSLASLINAEGVTVSAGVATVWLGLVDYLDRDRRRGAFAPADHARRVVGAAGADGSPGAAPWGYRPDQLGNDRVVTHRHRHTGDGGRAQILTVGPPPDRCRPPTHRCRRDAVAAWARRAPAGAGVERG